MFQNTVTFPGLTKCTHYTLLKTLCKTQSELYVMHSESPVSLDVASKNG